MLSLDSLKLSSLLCVLLSLFVHPPARGDDSEGYARSLIARAQRLALAGDSQWLALGHWHREARHKWRSHVADDSWFLAAGGATDPADELRATVLAFFETGDAQCRYRARYLWLRERLAFDSGRLRERDCVAYQTWLGDIHPGAATLIFASAYLNAPSSMFGHSLLRIDSADNPLLSHAVNFAADVPEGTGGFGFAFKGLTGGYQGRFFLMPYYDRLRKYSRLENRDIWEYPLNLSPDELELLLAHVWEMQDVALNYYFFDENCSYRLLELLEAARPDVRLSDAFTTHAIPVDTVRSVVQNGFADQARYRPASARLLMAEIEGFDRAQRRSIRQLADGQLAPDDAQLRALPEYEQSRLIRAAHRYLRYRIDAERRDTARRLERAQGLVGRLNGLAEKPDPVDVQAPVAAHRGHRSARVSLALGHQDGGYAQFGVRPAYHGLLDNLPGYDRGAEISVLDTGIRVGERSVRLQHFDLVSIRSYASTDAFLRAASWQFAVAAERHPIDEDDGLRYQISGGAGLSQGSGRRALAYALATARLEYGSDAEQALDAAPGIDAGLLYYNKRSTGQVAFKGDYLMGNTQLRYSLSVGYNRALSTGDALRVAGACAWSGGAHGCDLRAGYLHFF